MEKIKIYDVLFWTSILVIAIWVFLKMIGVIQSPVWVEMIPYAGAIFAVGAFYQLVKTMRIDITDLKVRTNSIEKDITELKTGIKHADSDLHFLKRKFA